MSNPSRITLDDPVFLRDALDVDDARTAARTLAEQRKEARRFLEQRIERAADAKREYRKALAQAFVTADGSTAAQREANAKEVAADMEYQRDLAEGMVKVAHEKLAEIDGERASLHRLLEWSMRVDPNAREDRAPADPVTFGARRAA
jgi:hypothetical protein